METPSEITKRLHGPEVHVYKAGRLYLKDFFFSPKRPCSVMLKGRTLIVSEAARDFRREYCLKNAKIMIQQATQKIVIELESGEKLFLFAANDNDLHEWSTVFADSIHWKIQRYYELGDALGQGAFGTVAKGLCKESGEPVAIKIIDKTNCNQEDFKYLQRELNISQKLHDVHIVRTLDLFESEHNVYMVLEYVEGGTLQAFLERHGSVVEDEARRIMRDIFSGTEYIHNNKVVHRDIKPENMLCTAKQFPMTVKLTDFGLARSLDSIAEGGEDRYDFDDYVGPGELMSTPVGTPKFVAPEILLGAPYGKEIDLFACGVVMYWLLCGYLPFDHPDTEKLIVLIKQTAFKFPKEDWDSVSPEAKQLVSQLLSREPCDRPTAAEALRYPWFSIPEKQGRTSRSMNKELQGASTETPGVISRISGPESIQQLMSRSSQIDDLDDISEVIRTMSGIKVNKKTS